jgi:hypothetical protein
MADGVIIMLFFIILKEEDVPFPISSCTAYGLLACSVTVVGNVRSHWVGRFAQSCDILVAI